MYFSFTYTSMLFHRFNEKYFLIITLILELNDTKDLLKLLNKEKKLTTIFKTSKKLEYLEFYSLLNKKLEV